jgi:hypothetical protein
MEGEGQGGQKGTKKAATGRSKPKTRILFKTKRPRIIADIKPSDDQVFIRLSLDLQLARRVQQQIARGIRPQKQLDDAKELERGAFQDLFNYCNARA